MTQRKRCTKFLLHVLSTHFFKCQQNSRAAPLKYHEQDNPYDGPNHVGQLPSLASQNHQFWLVKTKPESEPELGLIPDSVLELEPEAGPGFGIKTRPFGNKLFWEKKSLESAVNHRFQIRLPRLELELGLISRTGT